MSIRNANKGFTRLFESYLTEDIESTKRQYPHIPEEDFDRIIRLDPTFDENRDQVGRYGKWLLGMYKKDNPLNHSADEVFETISEYDSKKNDRNWELSITDVGRIKSLEEMREVTNSATRKELTDRQKQRGDKNGYTMVMQGKKDHWAVFKILNHEGAIKLGKGSGWCTADSRTNYYDHYLEQGGAYYVIMNMDDPSDKYQVHFESDQLFKSGNGGQEIQINDWEGFFNERPEVAEYFASLGYLIEFSLSDYSEELSNYIRTIYSDLIESQSDYLPNIYNTDALINIAKDEIGENSDFYIILDWTMTNVVPEFFRDTDSYLEFTKTRYGKLCEITGVDPFKIFSENYLISPRRILRDAYKLVLLDDYEKFRLLDRREYLPDLSEYFPSVSSLLDEILQEYRDEGSFVVGSHSVEMIIQSIVDSKVKECYNNICNKYDVDNITLQRFVQHAKETPIIKDNCIKKRSLSFATYGIEFIVNLFNLGADLSKLNGHIFVYSDNSYRKFLKRHPEAEENNLSIDDVVREYGYSALEQVDYKNLLGKYEDSGFIIDIEGNDGVFGDYTLPPAFNQFLGTHSKLEIDQYKKESRLNGRIVDESLKLRKFNIV